MSRSPSRSERSAIDVRRVEGAQELGRLGRLLVGQLFFPERVEGGDPARGDERHAHDERHRLQRAGQTRARSPRRAEPPRRRASLRIASAEPGVAGTDSPSDGPVSARTVPMLRSSFQATTASRSQPRQREAGLGQDLEGLVERGRLVDGDRGVDQLALLREPGQPGGRPPGVDAGAHRFGSTMTTIGIGVRNLYP